jgi:hypothetical protein
MGLYHAPAIAAPQAACSVERYEQADATLVNAAIGWRSLLQHHKTFAACDDGYLAEGYSDSVVRLLAYRWDQLDVLAVLSKQNPAFRRWVIRHIDATASSDDLETVARNAATCMGSAKNSKLCRAIEKAASNALKD